MYVRAKMRTDLLPNHSPKITHCRVHWRLTSNVAIWCIPRNKTGVDIVTSFDTRNSLQNNSSLVKRTKGGVTVLTPVHMKSTHTPPRKSLIRFLLQKRILFLC